MNQNNFSLFSAPSDSNSEYYLLGSNSEQMLKFISSVDYDITACLTNCSNHGTCQKNRHQKFECFCDPDFYGKSCEKNKKLCLKTKMCINNSTCVDVVKFDEKNNKTINDFKCLCGKNYFGLYCENEVNLCENKTCSAKGLCKINENGQPICQCFLHYNGEDCEIKNNQLKFIELIIKTSSIISIAVLGT